MPKIIIFNEIHKEALRFLKKQEGLEIVIVGEQERNRLLSNLIDADAIILRYLPFDNECFKVSKNLKVISRHGVGYDNVDMDSANKFCIPVTTIGNENAVTVAELTMYFILSSAKQGPMHDKAVRTNNWKIRDNADAIELAGKNVLILGFGRIGSRVAKRIKSFETNVYVYDPYISQELITNAGCIPVSNWQDIIPDIDILTIHVPLNKETEFMINETVINKIKPGSILVNTARGAIVDTESVSQGLLSGKFFGIGFDVFNKEPPNADDPIIKSERSILTPHVGGLTKECSIRSSMRASQNAIDGINGKLDEKYVVNIEVFE